MCTGNFIPITLFSDGNGLEVLTFHLKFEENEFSYGKEMRETEDSLRRI